MPKLARFSAIALILLLATNPLQSAIMKQDFEKMKQTMNQLASLYEHEYFERMPEMALFFGRSDAAHNRFSDHSQEALKAWEAREDDFLQQLRAIDPKALIDTPEAVTYALLLHALQSSQNTRICNESLWGVSHMWGWHNFIGEVATKQPLGTAQLRHDALARWQGVDKIADDEIANLKLGIKMGYTAPKPVVKRVLIQLDAMINVPIEESPFYDLVSRDTDPAYQQAMRDIIQNKINPALKRFQDYLSNEYIHQARDSIGMDAFPQGQACYNATLNRANTLNLSAEQIYAIGEQHMIKIEGEVIEIGQRLYGLNNMAEIFQRVKNDPKNLFKSEVDILAYNEAALDRAKAKAPHWFDMMPKADGVLKPYPLYRAKTGSSGEYHPPKLDGTQPGIFYINTYEPEKRSRVDHEATLFHELIPGHHFQVALAQEDPNHHTLDQILWNSGFGEGWALYVERLADEMGLYSDDVSRLGMLSNEAMRTARLMIDPGLHVKNWTREQAVQFMQSHTALDQNLIESEVDRYIIMPGQATSYMLGKHHIERLREQSKAKLGDKFEIREFHNQVLKNGCVTLPFLEEEMQRWWDKH